MGLIADEIKREITQGDKVLSHLKNIGQLTPLEALSKYGCFRLAAVVLKLKKAGSKIVTHNMSEGGKQFASYELIPEGEKGE